MIPKPILPMLEVYLFLFTIIIFTACICSYNPRNTTSTYIIKIENLNNSKFVRVFFSMLKNKLSTQSCRINNSNSS